MGGTSMGSSSLPDESRCEGCGIGIFSSPAEAKRLGGRYDIAATARHGRLCVGCAHKGIAPEVFVELLPTFRVQDRLEPLSDRDIEMAFELFREGNMSLCRVSTSLSLPHWKVKRQFKERGFPTTRKHLSGWATIPAP